jgi:Zn-dependent protease with chaperone function
MLPESAPLQVVAWVGTYLVHSTLLLTLAWVLTRRAERLSLAAREGIWKLAVAGGFLTATLQIGLGLEPPLLHLALQREPAVAELETGSEEAPDQPAAVSHGVVPDLTPELATAPIATRAPRLLHEHTHAAERSTRAPRAEVEPALFRAPVPAPQLTRDASTQPACEPGTSTAQSDEEETGEDAVVAFESASLASMDALPASFSALLGASLDVASFLVAERGTANDDEPRASAVPTGGEPPQTAATEASATSIAPLAAIVPSEWSRAALLAWSLAGLACALGLTLGMRRLRSDLLGRTELRDGPVHDELAHLALRAGLRRRVRLYVAPRLAAPLSMGWLRPAVCVPPRALAELADDERRAMLAHEVAHLARRDPAWHLALSLCETACFFQPLNRLARRELGATFELAADAWAARATGERLALASCLARIAGWVVGSSCGSEHRAWSAALTEGLDARRLRSRLGQRIERLLDEGSLAEPPRRPGLELTIALGSIALLALFAPGAAAARSAALSRPHPAPTAVPAPSVTPKPEPAAAPVASSPALRAATAALERLDDEMASLQSELEVLRAELGSAHLGPRLQALLAEVEQRLVSLGERRERIRSLLEPARHAPSREPAAGPSTP